MENNYIDSVKKQFLYYKMLGEKAMEQIPEEKLFWLYNEESNSIATLVKHLTGNMLSRWTDFFTSDGEKEWRNRDSEFVDDVKSRQQLIEIWDMGWKCLFNVIGNLKPEDLERIVYIRNQGHTVVDAINRQLAHYPYHIGQIVFLAKMVSEKWNSLSIPKNKSAEYNSDKFSKEKSRQHFTDEIQNKKK